MSSNEKSNIYKMPQIQNLKELTNMFANYEDNIAFKYKKFDTTSTEKFEYVNISFKQFKLDIDCLGTKLIDLGLKNKKIAIIGPNCYEWCISYFACVAGTGVVVPLDKSLPDTEIENLIIRSNVEAVIYNNDYSTVFEKIKKEKKSSLKYFINMSTTPSEHCLKIFDLISDGKKLLDSGNQQFINAEINNDEMSIMLFTSGTTSMSKAVMLSHSNIASNVNSICRILKTTSEDTLLSFLPLHHTFECTTTFLSGLYMGSSIAFCDGIKYIAKNMEEYKITTFVVVPILLESMYKRVLKGIESSGKTDLIKRLTKISNFLLKFKIDIRKQLFKSILDKFGGKLNLIVSGAAALDKKTLEGFRGFGITVLQGYGLTETSPVVAVENQNYMKAGSVGVPLYDVEIKINEPDKDGIGEIIIKGPNVMLGYYNNEEETNKVLKNGWFYTGDIGYIDEQGFIFLTSRQKNVIVLKNGKNIFPEELEVLVNNITGVAESIVYGKPDKDNDLIICVKIVYDENTMKETYPNTEKEDYSNILKEEIKKINKTMPAYKYIRDVIVTDEPLIKTTTQKVKRHEEIAKILK